MCQPADIACFGALKNHISSVCNGNCKGIAQHHESRGQRDCKTDSAPQYPVSKATGSCMGTPHALQKRMRMRWLCLARRKHYRVLRWIGYFRPEIRAHFWNTSVVGGSRAVDILQVTGRVCGRAGCLHESTFLIKIVGNNSKNVSHCQTTPYLIHW